ncbi:uncharacterized protein LOC129738543 [Uranotaenia lowii]|uniref:uncharacterized protein LOC129738543 n=1 Tax=Uranotaenia lowii TaxID=190385 RepID=UPI002479DC98|nr:uncharacterized protein LOC129738543 [Uranotaenia lowii]
MDKIERKQGEGSSTFKATAHPPFKVPPRSIAPIAEASKSPDSSLLRQQSVLNEPDNLCDGNFRPSLLIVSFSIHWILSGAVTIVGLVFILWPPQSTGDSLCHLYFAIVYWRMVFWIGTYAQHELIKPPCQRLINQNFCLYRDMTCYRKAPLQIVSIWNTMLIGVQLYTHSLFAVSDRNQSICAHVGPDTVVGAIWDHKITPQLFIVLFCLLETLALSCFYVPAIKRLVKSTKLQEEEDSPNRTLSNQDDVPLNQRLKRQAEQVKILRMTTLKLRRETQRLERL